MTIKLIFILAFVGILIWVGYAGMRKTKNINDFFLGGRNIGLWLSAFSYGTTYFSAVIFIGFAGQLGWNFGSRVLWIAFGNSILGALVAWLILAKATRRITTSLNAMTMPEFLEARYSSTYLKYFAAFIIFLFLTPYSASVYKGLGYLFEKNVGMSFNTALFFMAAITAVYLVMGGYHAVNIADLIQGLIMLAGAILMVFYITNGAGGFEAAQATIAEKYPQHVPNRPPGIALFWLVLLTSLGPWGMPQMVQKFYAIKDEKIIPKAAIITTIFAIVISFSAYYCGSLTHCYFDPSQSSFIDLIKEKDKASFMNVIGQATIAVDQMKTIGKSLDFDRFIPTLLMKQTPPWLNIMILLLVLSASMSTLAGLVLVSSSAIAIDFYQGKNPDENRKKTSLFLMRILCVVFVILSVVIAKNSAYIVTLLAISWGLVAGCFLAPYIYGLFFKKGSCAAVWICMIFVIAFNIISMYFYNQKGIAQQKSPQVGVLSMLIPMIIFPIASFIFPPKKTSQK